MKPNYRVVVSNLEDEEICTIRQVWYNEAGEAIGLTQEEVAPVGNTPEEFAADFEEYINALKLLPLRFPQDFKFKEVDGPPIDNRIVN